MLFAMKEGFKRASITAFKTATRRTKAATIVTTTVRTAGPGEEAAKQGIKTAKIEKRTATKWKELLMKTTKTRTNYAIKVTELVGKIGTSTEATVQAMKTAMTTGSKGKAVTKMTETTKKVATAGTETATNETKTVVKTATTGKEAALQTMRIAIEATSNEQAATKTIETAKKVATAGTETAVKAKKVVVQTATTGKEADLQAMRTAIEAESREQAAKKTTKKAVIADINTATTGAEDVIQAMKSPMTMSSRKKAKTRSSVVTGHNTKSSLTLPEVPASNAIQSSNLNETMHALQKQINELIPRIIEEKEYENDVIVIVKTVINPDTKEKTKVIVLKTVIEEDEKTFTVGGVRANKGSEICVKDVNITSIGRISVNEGFDTQPDDHPIIRFLRRLFLYIDVKAFMTFIKAMLRNKHVQNGGKMLSKHIIDYFLPGSFIILNLADGLHQIHKGDIGAGIVCLLSVGLYVSFQIDITPIDAMEGGTTQFSSVSDMNGEPLVADLKGEIEYEITLTAISGIVITIKSKTANKNASKAR